MSWLSDCEELVGVSHRRWWGVGEVWKKMQLLVLYNWLLSNKDFLMGVWYDKKLIFFLVFMFIISKNPIFTGDKKYSDNVCKEIVDAIGIFITLAE